MSFYIYFHLWSMSCSVISQRNQILLISGNGRTILLLQSRMWYCTHFNHVNFSQVSWGRSNNSTTIIAETSQNCDLELLQVLQIASSCYA